MMQSVCSENYESLKKLRTILNSKVTDHFLELLAESTYHKLSKMAFIKACKSFADSFEPIPTKMFPLLIDFLKFKGASSEGEVISKTHRKRIECASKLNRDIKGLLNIDLWKIEDALKLGIQPEKLPMNASELNEQQRIMLNIPDKNWRDSFFKELNIKVQRIKDKFSIKNLNLRRIF